MIETDASTTASLTDQVRELTLVLALLYSARADLVPAASTFWGGGARELYDRSVADLSAQLDDVAGRLERARRSTSLALTEVRCRG